jgi:molecular chaperone GrpE
MDQHESPTVAQSQQGEDVLAEAGGATTDASGGAPQSAGEGVAEPLPAEPDHEERAAADGRTPGELLAALEEVDRERGQYLDALQRSMAEFENYRKRATREAAAARGHGTGDLATKLLDALDDVDRTVAAITEDDDAALAGGIRAVQRKLADVLSGVGVERVDETDVVFDATRHEAVQQVPADEPLDEPQVADVLRPGYLLGDRVLRAAMVVVRQ